jgi:cytochrome c biogenesis protein CcdA
MQLFIGPALILVGMVLADLLHLNRFYSGKIFVWLKKKQWHGFYALPMGTLLALSFCPATAAVFFGILIPLTIQHDQIIIFPLIFGLGATLPLIGIVVMVRKGGRLLLSKKWQKLIPHFAGWLIIGIGIYISVQQIFL